MREPSADPFRVIWEGLTSLRSDSYSLIRAGAYSDFITAMELVILVLMRFLWLNLLCTVAICRGLFVVIPLKNTRGRKMSMSNLIRVDIRNYFISYFTAGQVNSRSLTWKINNKSHAGIISNRKIVVAICETEMCWIMVPKAMQVYGMCQ